MGCCTCCGSYKEYTKVDDPEFREFPVLNRSKEDNRYCRQYPLSLLEPNTRATDEMRHLKVVFLGESAVGKSSIIRQKVSYKFDEEHTPTTDDYFVKMTKLQIEDIHALVERRHSINQQKRTSFEQLGSPMSPSTPSLQNRSSQIDDGTPSFHCILDIHDTAGSLECTVLYGSDHRQNINQWIWRAEVFVVVFDVTDLKSFENIETAFISRIIELRECEHPPIILIGNKADLLSDYENLPSGTPRGSRRMSGTPRLSATPRSSGSINMVSVNSKTTESPTNELDVDKECKERAVSMDLIEELCNKYNMPYIECSAKDRWNINVMFDIVIRERMFHESYHRSQSFMKVKGGDSAQNMYSTQRL